MVDGRITTIDLGNNLNILRELNIEKPAEVKSAGLIIINFSEDFMINCIRNGASIKFLDEMTKALKLFSDKDLILFSLYSVTGVTVTKKFMELINFQEVQVTKYIDNFIMYSNIPVENLVVDNMKSLAFRANFTILALQKLYEDKKPIVEIVNEYLQYLDRNIPVFVDRKNVSLNDMYRFLTEMSDTITLYTPKDYSKYSFSEWYLKKLAGGNE